MGILIFKSELAFEIGSPDWSIERTIYDFDWASTQPELVLVLTARCVTQNSSDVLTSDVLFSFASRPRVLNVNKNTQFINFTIFGCRESSFR